MKCGISRCQCEHTEVAAAQGPSRPKGLWIGGGSVDVCPYCGDIVNHSKHSRRAEMLGQLGRRARWLTKLSLHPDGPEESERVVRSELIHQGGMRRRDVQNSPRRLSMILSSAVGRGPTR